MKAFRCEYKDVICFVAAKNVGTARQTTHLSLKDAWGIDNAWTQIKVPRAPQYDEWASRDEGERCIAPEYISEEHTSALQSRSERLCRRRL